MTHSTDSFNVGVNKGEMTHSIRVTWLILYVDMAHVICVTWLIQYAWHGSFNMCDMTHSTWVVSKRVKWLIHMRGVIFSYVWHDSFIPVTWIVHTCDMTQSIRVTWLIQYVGHDSYIRVTALIHACVCVCDMTRPTRVTWLILHVWHDSSYTCDMTHPTRVTWLILHVWHDWFIRATWLIHTCDMTHSICLIWLIHISRNGPFICWTWLTDMCDMTHSHMHYNSSMWCDSFTHTLQFIRVIWLIHAYNNLYVWYDSFTHTAIHVCDL